MRLGGHGAADGGYGVLFQVGTSGIVLDGQRVVARVQTGESGFCLEIRAIDRVGVVARRGGNGDAAVRVGTVGVVHNRGIRLGRTGLHGNRGGGAVRTPVAAGDRHAVGVLSGLVGDDSTGSVRGVVFP